MSYRNLSEQEGQERLQYATHASKALYDRSKTLEMGLVALGEGRDRQEAESNLVGIFILTCSGRRENGSPVGTLAIPMNIQMWDQLVIEVEAFLGPLRVAQFLNGPEVGEITVHSFTEADHDATRT